MITLPSCSIDKSIPASQPAHSKLWVKTLLQNFGFGNSFSTVSQFAASKPSATLKADIAEADKSYYQMCSGIL